MPSSFFHNVVIVGGEVTPGDILVEGYQLTPDNVDEFLGWTGLFGDRLAGGGLLLSTGFTIVGRAELGDWVIKVDGQSQVEPAAGFSQRWIAV